MGERNDRKTQEARYYKVDHSVCALNAETISQSLSQRYKLHKLGNDDC